jgi:hypothetical protein
LLGGRRASADHLDDAVAEVVGQEQGDVERLIGRPGLSVDQEEQRYDGDPLGGSGFFGANLPVAASRTPMTTVAADGMPSNSAAAMHGARWSCCSPSR